LAVLVALGIALRLGVTIPLAIGDSEGLAAVVLSGQGVELAGAFEATGVLEGPTVPLAIGDSIGLTATLVLSGHGVEVEAFVVEVIMGLVVAKFRLVELVTNVV
jgi:hypothetical protein